MVDIVTICIIKEKCPAYGKIYSKGRGQNHFAPVSRKTKDIWNIAGNEVTPRYKH